MVLGSMTYEFLKLLSVPGSTQSNDVDHFDAFGLISTLQEPAKTQQKLLQLHLSVTLLYNLILLNYTLFHFVYVFVADGGLNEICS